MFLLRSHHPNPPVRTLNAIAAIVATDRAQRRTRQMAMCQRLAELGMELAEAAQREALRETQPPPPRRAPAIPGMPPHMADPPPFRSTTFGDLFTQIARCVRQAILLEARLDAGSFDHSAPTARTPRHEPAQSNPPRSHVPGDTTRLGYERLENDLAADAGRSPEAILAGITGELGSALATIPPSRQPRSNTATQRRATAAPPPAHPSPPKRPPPQPG